MERKLSSSGIKVIGSASKWNYNNYLEIKDGPHYLELHALRNYRRRGLRQGLPGDQQER